MEKEFYVIAFNSTHYAMMAEKKLKLKIRVQMMPTPRGITASCGLSLKFLPEQLAAVQQELDDLKLDPAMFAIYHIEKREGRYLPTPA